MCLLSKWRFPKKAKEDIICYKCLVRLDDDSKQSSLYTPIMYTEVDINKPLKAEGSSFTLFNDGHIKGEGYIHVYAYENILSPLLFKCIIPKGTYYHESFDGSTFCAKQIIFLEQIR